MDAEKVRLAETTKKSRLGGNGAHTCPSVNGVPFAKTTATSGEKQRLCFAIAL